MLDQVRKLVKHSAVYGLGLVGSSITNLVLTPIFLHRLSKPEYGMIEVLNVFSSMILFISTLGIASVLMKIYLNDCETDDDRKTLISSVVVFSIFVAILLSVATFLFSRSLSKLFFADTRYGLLLQWGVAGSGLMLIQQMTVLCLRAKQMPAKFVVVTLSQLGVIVAANLYLIWYKGMGVLGIQIASVMGAAVSLLIGLWMIRSDIVSRFSTGMIKYVLAMSLPLIPVSIVPWILNWSDRFFLNHYCGLDQTGLYAVGYKIGMLGIVLPVNAFQLAWSPLFFSNSGNEDSPRFCAKVLKYYVFALVSSGLILSIFSKEIIHIISNEEYWSASALIPYICVAYIFYGVQFFAVPIFINANKGKWLAMMMIAVAVVNLTLNYILIPKLGIWGAVDSTLVTFFLEAALGMGLASRLLAVPYEHWAFVKIVVAAGIVYGGFILIPGLSGGMAALKLLSAPIFLGLLFAMRFFGEKELALIGSISGSAIRRVNPRYRKAA